MPVRPPRHFITTGEDALKGIFAHEKLWCFGHQHQKDRKEFEYSLGIARRVVKKVGDCDDGPTQHFCACLIDVLNNNSFTAIFEFYLFSLSRHEDDPQQWRDYGQQGQGFAIGFAPALFAPTEMTLKDQAIEISTWAASFMATQPLRRGTGLLLKPPLLSQAAWL